MTVTARSGARSAKPRPSGPSSKMATSSASGCALLLDTGTGRATSKVTSPAIAMRSRIRPLRSSSDVPSVGWPSIAVRKTRTGTPAWAAAESSRTLNTTQRPTPLACWPSSMPRLMPRS